MKELVWLYYIVLHVGSQHFVGSVRLLVPGLKHTRNKWESWSNSFFTLDSIVSVEVFNFICQGTTRV